MILKVLDSPVSSLWLEKSWSGGLSSRVWRAIGAKGRALGKSFASSRVSVATCISAKRPEGRSRDPWSSLGERWA